MRFTARKATTYLLPFLLGILNQANARPKCSEPILKVSDVSGPCEGCPTASTPEEIDAVNAEYDSQLFLNEQNRYLCMEEYPAFRAKCYCHSVVERATIESGRAYRFEPGSAEREAADARVELIIQEILLLKDDC